MVLELGLAPAPPPPLCATLLATMQAGEIDLKKRLPYSSNGAYLVLLGETVPAVYKPTSSARPLWDFARETLCRREVAAFVVSETLGWRLVPPTVHRAEAPYGPGSVQLYIYSEAKSPYFKFEECEESDRLRMALFDLLLNNADRKRGHVRRDMAGKLWSIDHGICFHVQPKLRTFIYDLRGVPIPETLLADLRRFRRKLETDHALKRVLAALLAGDEIVAMCHRAETLLARRCF